MYKKFQIIFSSLLLLTFLCSSIVFAQGVPMRDCRLEHNDAHTDTSHLMHAELVANYSLMGYVSMQGNYADRLNSSRVLYPWGLFCDNRLNQNRADGAPTFNFSNPNAIVYTHSIFGPVYGSGRVTHSGVGVLFEGEAYHGFTEGKCEIKPISEGCASGDVCVLKTSNPNQGSVADCNNDARPYQNLFQYKICCTPTEVCNDGIDNTGDGLIDCASPDCHPSANNLNVPQQCAPGLAPGNNQSTADCIESTSFDGDGNAVTTYKAHCMGFHPIFTTAPYYCNYGHSDNSSIEPDGFCCPAGQWYDSSSSPPRCREFIKCGITSEFRCGYSFFNSHSLWLNEVFNGGFNWCNSRLPSFTNLGSGGSVFRSEACCPVVHQGKFDYFIVDSNVKIFGYE